MQHNGRLIGAASPFGTEVLSSYRMVDERYIGRVIYLTFRTQADLAPWVPEPLKLAEPHSAFLKIYHLTRNPVGEPSREVGFNAYHEVCLTVEATAPADPEPRHYNLGMWLDRDWAVYKAREIFGWPKKMAEIDAVWPILPAPGSPQADVGRRATFGARIARYGRPIIEVEGEVGEASATKIPSFNGFYSVRHLVAPDGDPRNRIRQLLRIQTRAGWASEPVFANAKVNFGSCGDEQLSLLGDVEVTGCTYRGTGWILPAFPATIIEPNIDFDPRIA